MIFTPVEPENETDIMPGSEDQKTQAPSAATPSLEDSTVSVAKADAPTEMTGVPTSVIESLIAASGKSRHALSRALGKDPSYLSGVLTRGRRMPPDLLAPLARACGVEEAPVLAAFYGVTEATALHTIPVQTTAACAAPVENPVVVSMAGSVPELTSSTP